MPVTGDGAVDDLEDLVRADSTRLREAQGLGDQNGAHGRHEIVDDLYGHAVTHVTAVDDRRAHGFQRRHDRGLVLGRAGHHEHRRALTSVVCGPADGRIDVAPARGLRLLGEFQHGTRIDGAHHHDDASVTGAAEQAIVTIQDGVDFGYIRHHDDDQLRAVSRRRRRRNDFAAVRLDAVTGTRKGIVTLYLETRLEQVVRHRRTHQTEADEADLFDLAHESSLSRNFTPAHVSATAAGRANLHGTYGHINGAG